jgi:hypothetical protein
VLSPAAVPEEARTGTRARKARSSASDAAWRRELLDEVQALERRRVMVARGLAQPLRTLACAPRCQEAVQAVTHRLASTSRWPRDSRLTYRGQPLFVRVSNLGRVFVELADGRQVGASAFGALWEGDD